MMKNIRNFFTGFHFSLISGLHSAGKKKEVEKKVDQQKNIEI